MEHARLLELLDAFHAARVLIVGDVMLDRFVYGMVNRISPEAPIPVMTVERSADMPGGAANVARNVAMMGATATVVGVIGDDQAGEDLQAQMSSIPNIKTRLVVDGGRPTTVKVRYVADRQQILRTDIESTLAISREVSGAIADAVQEELQDVDVVVISDYAKGLLTNGVVKQIVSSSRSAGKEVIVDPKSRDFARYAGATVLTPNRLELQLASNKQVQDDDEIIRAAQDCIDSGICRHMLVTRGGDGMTLVAAAGVATHLRAVTRDVFDVSGAGDTAVAALALGRAVGGTMVEAATLSNIAAGIVVGKAGTAAATTAELVATIEQVSEPASGAKILTRPHAVEVARQWKDRGLTVGFTNGCFDLLHPGHVHLLERARSSVDRLIVGLNSDLSVARLKGPGRPVQSEIARATVLASLRFVDAVVVFAEDTPIDLIRDLQPDVLVKGSDYTIDSVIGADLVMSWGGRVVLVDLVKDQSTTGTIQRLQARVAK